MTGDKVTWHRSLVKESCLRTLRRSVRLCTTWKCDFTHKATSITLDQMRSWFQSFMRMRNGVRGSAPSKKKFALNKCCFSAHNITQPCGRGGHGFEAPESTPAGLCVFLSEPGSKIFQKPDPESLLIFCSSRSPRGLCTCHFYKVKTAEFRLHWWLLPESEQESDFQIFLKLSDLDSKILEQERSRKM